MQLTNLLAFLTTLKDTTATPQANPSAWKATNWTLDCSPGGCIYSFNITGAASQNTPAFNALCEGQTPNATRCTDQHITATVTPLGNPLWKVNVEHEWHIIMPQQNSEQTYWQYGSANVTEMTRAFQIIPDIFYGVA